MPIDKGAIKPGARLTVRMLKDLYDLLDGTIVDVDITLGRNLTVRGSMSTIGSVNQVAPGPGNVPFSVQGAAGQTANLFEARNSAGDLLFAVGPTGILSPVRITDYSLSQHNHTTIVTGGLLGAGAFGGFEALYAGTWVNVSSNYTVPLASNILYVFTGALTVTLPAAASCNRPIEIIAVSGNASVVAAGGTVYGGSINTSNGTIMNGTVTAGDAITYKSDGVNWRAV